ncbi:MULTISPECIES: type II toxin-antitoxin system prevent-host-death family antitoxin [Enterococcus]|uniref:Antitoxin n=1 Tax=Candidatus Enterococcus ferrettii TaxID=2815324 RepID=A0ABV0EYD8_9ENTE|nr:type II toxin-antitoxin system prevent-host-death family antitoxin [Enterococcus sp. 665A]MBO1338629.1 type II toxin-antitoxin system prevent-host-death family antitoxin [Enterococcus sp. 665A]
MLNIKPVSDLRNYNKLLEEVTNDQPVFLTKNGRGMYAIINIEEYDRLKASIEIVEKLKQAEKSGVVDLSDARKKFGL